MLRRDLYIKKLEMYTGRDVCKIITGVRRCGKTTIIKQFIEELKQGGVPEENIIYINFEGLIYNYFTSQEALRDMLAEFINGAAGHCYVFLDEVQGVSSWAKVCSEMMNLFDCDIYVSSSGSGIFYDGFQKDLSYRYIRIDVYPFIFSEFAEYAASDEKLASLSPEELFDVYIRRGAFPAVYSMDEAAAESWLKDTYSAIVLKDVVQCNRLRDISHIDKITGYIMSNIGEIYSPKGMRDYIRDQGITISVDTVYSVLDALCASGLIYRVPRYDIKNDKELETQEKYYVCDTAMMDAIMGGEGSARRRAMENILHTELLTRGFKVYVGKQGRYQVDFMAVKSEDRTYLNCCEYLSSNEAIRTEFNPLVKIRDNYFKMVLSMDEETKVNKGGIINFPLIKFLLQG